MIDPATFERIKTKYGDYASWAIWASEGSKPKDNMGDLSLFDDGRIVPLLEQLNPNVILVGLNISKRIEHPLSNFHGANGGAYKIRYALKDTPFWGAYMTDIIKDFEQKISGKVQAYLRANPAFEQENIRIFRDEIRDLGSDNPTLVAFGTVTHAILKRNLDNQYKILMVPHYSNYTRKEIYREEVRQVIESDYRQGMQ